eukprot:11538392-Alexandrium_andersonii.AAC.1
MAVPCRRRRLFPIVVSQSTRAKRPHAALRFRALCCGSARRHPAGGRRSPACRKADAAEARAAASIWRP